MLPFKEEKISELESIRTFGSNVDFGDLYWHRDREDRTIVVISSDGWKFQFDNSIPTEMTNGSLINIKKGQYHRIIKGSGDLKIKVIKKNISNRSRRVQSILEIINNSKS